MKRKCRVLSWGNCVPTQLPITFFRWINCDLQDNIICWVFSQHMRRNGLRLENRPPDLQLKEFLGCDMELPICLFFPLCFWRGGVIRGKCVGLRPTWIQVWSNHFGEVQWLLWASVFTWKVQMMPSPWLWWGSDEITEVKCPMWHFIEAHRS